MDASPFNRLPAEIRNYVYELAFIQSPVDVFYNDHVPSKFTMEARHGHRMNPLPKTCRQIRAESSGLFYSCTTFNIYLNKPSSYPYRHSRGLTAADILAETNPQSGLKRLTRQEHALVPLTRFVDTLGNANLLRIVPHIGIYPIYGLSDGSGLPWLLYTCSSHIKKSSPSSLLRKCSTIKFTLTYWTGGQCNSNDFTIDCHNIKESLNGVITALEEMGAKRSEDKTSFAKAVLMFRRWNALGWDKEDDWRDSRWL